MPSPTRAIRPTCPDCGFAIFNRRFPKCESCGAVLPVSIVYTADELEALRAKELEADKQHQANLARLKGKGAKSGGGGGDGGVDVDGFDFDFSD